VISYETNRNITNFQIQSSKEINKVNEDTLKSMLLEHGAFSHYGTLVVSI